MTAAETGIICLYVSLATALIMAICTTDTTEQIKQYQIKQTELNRRLCEQDSVLSVYARQIDRVKQENKYMHYLLNKR